jgi:PKD repeat protein
MPANYNYATMRVSTGIGLLIILLLFITGSACAYNFGPIDNYKTYIKPTPAPFNSKYGTTITTENVMSANFIWLASWENGAYQSPIMFIDTSSGDPLSWLWDFGDGTTSTIQNPVHIYQTNGTYTIYLTVWNNNGGEAKTAKTEWFQTSQIYNNIQSTSPDTPYSDYVAPSVSASDTDKIKEISVSSGKITEQQTTEQKSPDSNYQRHMADLNQAQARKEVYIQNTFNRAVEYAQERMNYVLSFARSISKSDRTSTEVSRPDITTNSDPITSVDYSIAGGASNTVVSCLAPDNTLKLTGVTGSAVSPGTLIQFIIISNPNSGTHDLPTEGVVIGSTNTLSDRSWEYTWNGNVPGYSLTNSQGYGIKCVLPSGKYTITKFEYQCTTSKGDLSGAVSSDDSRVANTVDPDYSISAKSSNTVLFCSAPNNVLTISGSTGSAVSPGAIILLKVFNKPGSGIQDLPADGILIASRITQNDGSWEYSWNGNVPGYTLTNGQTYGVKCILPSGKYTIVGFVYECIGSISGTSTQVATAIPDTNSFSSLVKSLDTPAKAAQYTQAHYNFVWHDGCISYPPEEFYRLEKGDCKDVATFLSYIIAQHGYDAKIISFRYSQNGEEEGHVLTLFTDADGKMKYSTIPDVTVFREVTSIDDLLAKERVRLSATEIAEYKIFPAGARDVCVG